jgi:uncharacterized protein YbaP (TraB family)
MKQRVALCVLAALVAAAGCGNKKEEAGAGSASGSGSDPWASSGSASGSGTGTGAGTGTGSSAEACPPAPKTAAPPAVTAKLAKPFFFHATKPGMANLWLFGTIHLGVAPDAIPDAVLDKLDHSERFAMETDINDPSLLSAIMRSDGKTLEQELGPKVWHQLACALGDATAKNLEHMKASTAATLLDVQGMPMTTPMDMFLLLRARKDGKGIVFLEPATKQLALLDKWMDAKSIEASLQDLDEARKKNIELIDAYAAGDDAKAIEMSKDDSDFVKAGKSHGEFVQMMKELLLDRNASWIPEIEDMAKKGDAFVAVGAMHLLGDGSVIDRLTKNGWKIERITP